MERFRALFRRIFSTRIVVARWQFNAFGLFFLFFGTVAGAYLILSNSIPRIFGWDVENSWDFSSSVDYARSSGVEFAGTPQAARLSIRNYETDAHTAALYHFDEASGSTLNDSSSSANHATLSNGSLVSGSLNNAVSFNGATASATAPDSAATSVTDAFTVETWARFPSGFDADTAASRQGVLDKGAYQLYFDDVTGKVNFEMAPSNADAWAQVAGADFVNANGVTLNRSWDQNSKNFVWRQVAVGNDIYVSLGSANTALNGTALGDAEVWKCTDCATSPSWSQIGGDGINSSWDDGQYQDASSLVSDGTNLYAGLGNNPANKAEVWRWNGSTWSKVGGDGVNSSWNTSYERVTTLVASGTTVYAGLGLSAGDAEVWKCTECDGGSASWTKIGGDGSGSAGQSWATNTYEEVSALSIVNGNILAVGLGTGAGDAELWTCDLSGTCSVTVGWTKRGGDATGSGGQSWTNAHDEIRSITSSGTVVYVGVGVTAGEADVWRCDLGGTCTATSGWTQVGGDGLNSSWAASAYERVWSLLADGTTVYAGLGDSAGDAEVWKCTNCSTSPAWSKLGGDGTGIPPASWGNTGASFLYASSLAKIGNILFVGAGTAVGTYGAEVWRCDVSGTCSDTAGWTRIAGNSLNKSWGAFNLNSVESLTSVGGKLYAGTGYDTGAATANANAMVWEYDGSNWTMIGGQGVNSSWSYGHQSVSTVTYRSITSMTGYADDLIVGLGGGSNGDAEVWRWNGSTWTKIGGDGSGSAGQSWAAGTKRSVTSLSVVGSRLYAGLQGTAAGDGELWSCNLGGTCTTTAGWTMVGGDATGAGGQSWNNSMFEAIWSLTARGTNLYVGLGTSAGDAEVWTCDTGATCTTTAGWTRIGGDGVNSSWANSTYEEVTALSWYRGELYAGLGNTAGDAEIWKWNGSSWGGTAVAGDGLNGSWSDAIYERVKSIVSYDGSLIVALGESAGDGEVWQFDSSSWSRIGGDGVNSSWSNAIDRVGSLAVYGGRLYAGTGLTANSEAMVWSYGNNATVSSTTASWGTGWHHLAVTYDGDTLRLYIDGTLEGSRGAATGAGDTAHPLLVGALAGAQTVGGAQAYGALQVDEIRISDSVRDSFQTTPYSSDYETVTPTAAIRTSGVKSWDDFIAAETAAGGAVTYRLSDNGGTGWKYWNGSAWATSSSLTQSNDVTTINAHVGSFPVSTGGFLWQAVLKGNGNQQVRLDSVTLRVTSDTTAPTTPSGVVTLSGEGGSAIVSDTWYPHASPVFTWTGSADTDGSGIAGYYVYFGTDETADPETAGSYQTGNSLSASGLSSGSTYHLIVKVKDNAQNRSAATELFTYLFDDTPPSNPSGATAAPAVYSSSPDFTFLWGTGADTGSGIAGYQYQVGASIDSDGWSAITTAHLVDITGAAYQTGENYFWLRTVDNAGSPSTSPIRTSFYYAGTGATAPRLLTATPQTNTENNFTFDWDEPETYSSLPVGDPSGLTYCYTVNTLPTEDNCTFTAPGVTSAGPGPFATQAGINTFYVVAKEADNVGGSISYANYASVFFTANTAAPGMPLNTDIADVSVKNTSSWKLAISWEAPEDEGSGVDSYEVYRSEDGADYDRVATTSGIAFVDTGLDQQTYYYKIRACDNVHNCGAFGSAVSMYPTGKYTSAAELTAGPTVSLVTTKGATITWSTNRGSDSKVQYGKKSGEYFDEEPSNSDQLTEHSIRLTNLSPGTTYSFRTRWTDEDGNTGVSGEKTFKTSPAPTITDPQVKTVSLSSAVVEFTSKGAQKVKIYYGTSSSFGAVKEVSVSSSESTYTVSLDELADGTKYYYRIDSIDSEEESYEGNVLSFETLPRPKIQNVRIQQAKGTAQTILLVTWETNTEVSSIVTYYPEGVPDEARDEVDVKLVSGVHKIVVRGLLPQTPYALVVKGRDKMGNEAVSDVQRFTTATDTRPPQVIDSNVEGMIVTATKGGSQQEAEAQLVVSWNTDEPATSQVEFGEGTGTTYAQKTQEDSNLVSNHTVVISKLAPSKVYHLRIVSKDKAGNVGNSVDIVSITPKATENALDIVFASLKSIFGN